MHNFKCGIHDVFKDVALLDASQSRNTRNIIVTLEDKKRFQVFTNKLDLDAQVSPFVTKLSAAAEEQFNVLTTVVASSARIQFLNSIRIDPLTYEYVEGPGINLTPDLLLLAPNDLIVSLSGDIVLTGEDGAPYYIGDGIIITEGLLREETPD